MKNVLLATKNNLWLVVGYSGENDTIFPQIESIKKFLGGFYWAGLGDYRRWRPHVKKLCESDRDVSAVSIKGADELMAELSIRLECFPPPLLLKPVTLLYSALNALPAWTAPVPGADLTRFARQSLPEALERERNGASELFIRMLRKAIEKPPAIATWVREHIEAVRTDPELKSLASLASFQAARELSASAVGDRLAAKADPDAATRDHLRDRWHAKTRDARDCLALSDQLGGIEDAASRERLEVEISQLEFEVKRGQPQAATQEA